VLKQWTTKAGLEAKAVLVQIGNINGYVAVNENSAYFKLPHYNNDNKVSDAQEIINNIKVHGGLTYSGNMNMADNSTLKWCFGFDTAHWGDAFNKEMTIEHLCENQNDIDLINKYMSIPMHDGVFRDLDYVENQCEKLAEQLKEEIK
jgi:hypothetical protein